MTKTQQRDGRTFTIVTCGSVVRTGRSSVMVGTARAVISVVLAPVLLSVLKPFPVCGALVVVSPVNMSTCGGHKSKTCGNKKKKALETIKALDGCSLDLTLVAAVQTLDILMDLLTLNVHQPHSHNSAHNELLRQSNPAVPVVELRLGCLDPGGVAETLQHFV